LFYGLVKWSKVDGKTIQFSNAGDSGSLVYFRTGDTTVPLGIHVGVTDAYSDGCDCSYFISVDSWFALAKEHKINLRFLST
jgi:hypothetical protein